MKVGTTDTRRIGEISMVRDLEKTMEISQRHEEENATKEEQEAAAVTGATAAESSSTGAKTVQPDTARTASTSTDAKTTTSDARSFATGTTAAEPPSVETLNINDEKTKAASAPYETERPKGVSTRLAITDSSSVAEQDARDNAAGVTEEEKALRQKQKKKGGLSKEQREELAAFEQERNRVRDERVETLAKKLVDRISLWTETDKGADVTAAFKAKMELEAENLKMESFGLEILHAVGTTYTSKSNTYIKSQKPLIGGVSGFFSRLKDKGNLVRETWGTVSTAISAQMEIEDMARLEEKGGEDWTDERKMEAERRVTGKILAAAWRGSKFEIQSVLRDVCDKILYDKTVKTEKRLERAHALQIIADVFVRAHRSEEEESDQFMFEQLVREAAEKKKDPKKEKHDKEAKEKLEKHEKHAREKEAAKAHASS